MSYKDSQRIYSSCKSSWREFKEGLDLVMEKCVSKGTGGAYLVPRKFYPSVTLPPTLPSLKTPPFPLSVNW